MSWYYNHDQDDYDGDDTCPCCGKNYDEIDYEYQICHYCKHENDDVKHETPELL